MHALSNLSLNVLFSDYLSNYLLLVDVNSSKLRPELKGYEKKTKFHRLAHSARILSRVEVKEEQCFTNSIDSTCFAFTARIIPQY